MRAAFDKISMGRVSQFSSFGNSFLEFVVRVFQEVATNLWPPLVNEAVCSISRGPEETLGGLSRVQLWRQGENKDLRQQQIRQANSYNKRYWIKSRQIGIV